MPLSRLEEHLAHIARDVVKQRGAAQAGLAADYIAEIEGRAMPPLLVRGLEQWNGGYFYAQHETLEFLWRATPDPVRDMMKGIIQSGVGAYHVLNHNRRGALGKWTGAVGYLEPFAEIKPYGIAVGALRDKVIAARAALLEDSTDPPLWENHEATVRGWRIEWEGCERDPRVTDWLRRIDAVWLEGARSVEAGWEREAWTAKRAWLLHESLLYKQRLIIEQFPAVTDTMVDYTDERGWHAAITHLHDQLRAQIGFLSDGDLTATLENKLTEMMGRDAELARILWKE